MKNFAFVALLTLCLTGCSNLSKNNVKEGTFLIKNGKVQDKLWKENLSFKRLSWLHELTMQFDLMIADLPPQSGFNFWLSKGEQEQISKCSHFKIILAYTMDSKIIPHSYFNEQLSAAGYKRIELIEFKKHLLQHPDSEMSSLRQYRLIGACQSDIVGKPLKLNFPGYQEVTI